MANGQFRLPETASKFLPQELDEEFFASLDDAFARSDAKQTERVLEDVNARGFFRSGQALEGVTEEVLGPAQDRRRGALLGLAREGAFAGREERLGEEQFERTRQLAEEDHLRRLAELTRRAEINKELLFLEDSLSDSGGGFGEFLGTVAGIGAGSLFGGVGAGIGARVGRQIGRGGRRSRSSGNSGSPVDIDFEGILG